MHRIHHNLRWFVVLFVVLSLMVVAASCGSKPEEDAGEPTAPADPGQEEEEEEEEEEEPPPPPPPAVDDGVLATQWRNPDHIGSLIQDFSELAWTLTFDGKPLTAHYTLEGIDTVQGTDFLLIVIDVDLSQWEAGPDYIIRIWVDEDTWTTGQAELDGEIVDPMVAESITEGVLEMALLPFFAMDDLAADAVLGVPGAGPVPDGTEWRLMDSTTERFGDLQATVHWLEVDIRLSEDWEATQEWGIADFGEFQMLVEWVATIRDDDEAFTFHMKVDRIVPR